MFVAEHLAQRAEEDHAGVLAVELVGSTGQPGERGTSSSGPVAAGELGDREQRLPALFEPIGDRGQDLAAVRAELGHVRVRPVVESAAELGNVVLEVRRAQPLYLVAAALALHLDHDGAVADRVGQLAVGDAREHLRPEHSNLTGVPSWVPRTT